MNCQSNRKYPVGNNKKPKHQHQLHPQCESRSYRATQYYIHAICLCQLSVRLHYRIPNICVLQQIHQITKDIQK